MNNLKNYPVEGVTSAVLEAYAISLNKHISAVQEAGKKLGVPAHQLNHHDNSKMSAAEFPYYARQFFGDKGDPDGFAYAWNHHVHANPHHWNFWVYPAGFRVKGADIQDGALKMPEKYALEMVADWLGSSYTYTGSWDATEWLHKNFGETILHPATRSYVREVLRKIDNGRNL